FLEATAGGRAAAHGPRRARVGRDEPPTRQQLARDGERVGGQDDRPTRGRRVGGRPPAPVRSERPGRQRRPPRRSSVSDLDASTPMSARLTPPCVRKRRCPSRCRLRGVLEPDARRSPAGRDGSPARRRPGDARRPPPECRVSHPDGAAGRHAVLVDPATSQLIGTVVSVTAVVLSLLGLAFQVRPQTRALRAQNYDQALGRLAAVQARLSESERLASVFARGAVDTSLLTVEERIQFTWTFYEIFGAMEFMYDQLREGALPPHVWDRW